jgi:hypothetical protein
VVRGYETTAPERTPTIRLGSTRSRRIESGIWRKRREREAEDERAARYRAMYEDLGLRVVANRAVPWRRVGDSGRLCSV